MPVPGNDDLNGGAGVDQLWGSGGADRFWFFAASDAPYSVVNGQGVADRIGDFSFAAGDRIAFGTFDANASLAGTQAFAFAGMSKSPGTGKLTYFHTAGGDTHLVGNTDGDAACEFGVILAGKHTVTADYFTFG